MSLRLVSNIVITQQPTTTYPDRKNVYTLDFINDVEIKSSWKNLTTTAKIILPKNVYVKTQHGYTSWLGQSVYAPIPGDNNPPVILRGDRISISLGYYYDPGGGYVTKINEEFNGFITKINPKMPMEIECEDNMWLLKQAQCPNMVFPASKYSVQTIIQYLLNNPVLGDPSAPTYKYLSEVIKPALAQINVINGVGLSENVETKLGDFRTVNETICGVLMRLRKDYKLECFFRKNLSTGSWNDLYCSGIVYYPKDYINSDGTFNTIAYGFQQNVTDNGADLIYLRKDDVRLGIKAYSVSKYELTSTNSAGRKRTQNKRLEVLVGDKDGDIRTQFFWPATNTDPDLNIETLTAQATQRLNKLKFEGWRGEFESFILPYVQHGMAVSLSDVVNTGTNLQNDKPIVMERQGVYLVKSTTVKFGQQGARRRIELHLRIDNQGFTSQTFQNGL